MRIVVIGGDAAGMSAASQVRRNVGAAARIIVLERQSWTSYSACGIPYWIGGQVEGGPDRLVTRSPEQHRANGLDVRTRTEAVSIDLAAGVVRAEAVGAGGSAGTFEYDHLVVATGAVPLVPAITGLDLPGVHRAQTLDNGLAAIASLALGPRRAVVLGGGYIGLEMAEAAMDRGLDTTIVDLSPEPMHTLDVDMGARIRAALTSAGVDFHGDEPAREIVAGPDGRVAAVRTDRGLYPADIVFMGLGVRPRNELAIAAGLPVGDFGGILTDDHQRVVGCDTVWAGGDCTEVMDRCVGRRRHVPLGTHANHQGRVIGLNIAGGDVAFPGVVGTAITKFQATEIARTGARVAEAADFGLDVVCTTIEAKTRTGYMPGVAPLAVKMIAERGSGRVVGCQIVGGPGAGKRIDTAATAITNRMTAEQIIDLDLAYAPPVSGVWDPIQIAARQLSNLL
jgi:NADPH-dependent 2,4-dienoyl-CoA reductase/sulfur reductase-like enzyme